MTIKSDLALLKTREIEIKGYLKAKLKARHLQWLAKHIDDPVAEELFQIVIQERNERANKNSSQSLEISRKDGKITQLDRKNDNLKTENINLQQEVSAWQERFNQLRKQLLDFEQSEIYQLGLWLKNSLSKTGQERQDALLEQDLVHKENYNQAVSDLKYTIQGQQEGTKIIKDQAYSVIQDLEHKNDTLRTQFQSIQDYIVDRYGYSKWQEIATYLPNDEDLKA